MRFTLPLAIIITVSSFIIILSIAKETGGMWDSQSLRSIYRLDSSPLFFLDTNSSFYYTYSLTEGAYILVRKFGHFIAYGILAVMIFSITFEKKLLLRGGVAIGTASIIGAIDEYHQHFLLDRSGRLLDILVNTAGSTTFIIGVLFFHHLLKLRRKMIERIQSNSV